MDARKETRDSAGAMEVLGGASKVVAMRGKRVVEFDMKQLKSQEELLEQVLGPTGNLRAPTIRVGKIILVGFNEEVYQTYLADRK